MKRSVHSLSHYRLSTLNFGEIYPIACLEVLPGDTFRHDTSILLRCTPLLAPVMHPVHVQVHSWYVPARLLWSNWEDFIVDDQTELTLPNVQIDSSSTAGFLSLADAFGIGHDATPTTQVVNALPFRAYNLIWNEFYRDQDIDTAVSIQTGNTDSDANYTLLKARWEKDYFTTARVAPQQGDGATVGLDLTGGTGWFEELPSGVRTVERTAGTADSPLTVEETGVADAQLVPMIAGTINVNNLRLAMAQQRLREARNRFGSRYRDLLAFMGVTPSDARLQRPEYLGGGKQTIAFSEVLSTAETSEAALGAMGGHGIAALRTRPYRRFFEEHGYVLSFVIVRPRTLYMNNIPRLFTHNDQSAFWAKEYEIIGDDWIWDRELYYPANATEIFGYIPRYDSYRRHNSAVTGEFRTTLNTWHFGRNFGSQPELNSSFLECTPSEVPFVENTSDNFQLMAAHRIKARRLVSQRAHRSNFA